MLAAHPGIGTVVVATEHHPRVMRGAASLDDITQYAEATRMRLLGTREFDADEQWASRLGGIAGERWLEASVLRLLPEYPMPIAWMLLYMDARYRDVAGRIGTWSGPVFALLQQLHGVRIAEVNQRIMAITIDEPAAELLQSTPGAPALQITRRYLDFTGNPVLVSIGLYPSDRFTHDTSFRVQERL